MAKQNQSDQAVSIPQQATTQDHHGRARRLPSVVARERWRQSALATRPWERSTGPRTAAGKAQVALNGKTRQKGEKSYREKRAEMAEISQLLTNMEALRNAIHAAHQENRVGDEY